MELPLLAASSKMETAIDHWQNLTTQPHAPKTGTCRTEKQLKAEGAGGPLNAPHKMLLLPTRPISKLYNPEYKESDTRASITKPLSTTIIIIIIIGRSCS